MYGAFNNYPQCLYTLLTWFLYSLFEYFLPNTCYGNGESSKTSAEVKSLRDQGFYN